MSARLMGRFSCRLAYLDGASVWMDFGVIEKHGAHAL
jgi:hypothetical protein